ncbi:hypothetical protein [Asticcacaulis sp. YBE204]|uniref:hypothetical protein n=1 Tax=Asticcacaulis sp. YBE204 TaxID=1282363 RepID=UPI0012DD9A96|nr:hypothetical protein [Asticcacaulis sp. YBE204]
MLQGLGGALAAAVAPVPASAQSGDGWAYLAGRKWRGNIGWSDPTIEGGRATALLSVTFPFVGTGPQIEGELVIDFNLGGSHYYATYTIRGYCDRANQTLVISDGPLARADTIERRSWVTNLAGTLKFTKSATYPGHFALKGTLWEPTHQVGLDVQLLDMNSFTEEFPPRK